MKAFLHWLQYYVTVVNCLMLSLQKADLYLSYLNGGI